MSRFQERPQFSSNFRAISCVEAITVDMEKSEDMFETGNAPFTVLGREGCTERNSVGSTGNVPCDSISFMSVEWTMGRPHRKVKSVQNLAGARGILK